MEVVEAYNKKKEELIDEKKEADIKNEELRMQVKASEEMQAKRLQSQLQRNKTQEIKNKLAEQEGLKEFTESLNHKLAEEKEKYDKLSSEKIVRDEENKMLLAHMVEDKKVNEEQKKELDDL